MRSLNKDKCVCGCFSFCLNSCSLESFSETELNLFRRQAFASFTVIKTAHKRSFLDHINSTDQNIQFSSEDSRTDGSMPFLDILVTPKEDGSLSTSVYRKPTHSDLYLQWDSHHTILSKYRCGSYSTSQGQNYMLQPSAVTTRRITAIQSSYKI